MSEPEAFRWIQKSSMDRRMTMRAVAEEVLQGAQKPSEQAGKTGDAADEPSSGGAPGAAADGKAGENKAGQ